MPAAPRVLCVLILALLVGAAITSPSAAWAQRGPEARVYNTQLEPRWAPDGQRFWYRRERPGQRPELIVVDVVAGTSAPAFDPAVVAAQLRELTGEPIEPSQLPIEGLDFVADSPDLLLRGPKQSWRLNRSANTLTAAPPVPPESLPTDLPLRASRRTGPETEIVFRNATSHPIEIFWLEPGGARKSYGTLEPGAERPQHTFAGHRWLATGPEGQPLAVVQAIERRGLAIVDGSKLPRETGRPDRSTPPQATPSPDGRWEAFVRNHNLYLRERETGREIPLSVDGSAEASYHRDAIRSRAVEMNYDQPDWPESLAEVEWAPDSRHLLAVRTTTVAEPRVTLVESAPQNGGRPVLHTYPYLKPGDPLPRRELRLFDIPAQRAILIDHTLLDDPWNIDDLRWSKSGDRVWCVYNQRGHQIVRVLAIDAASGKVTPLVTETSATFVDYSGKFFLRLLEETGDLLWMSERDGWNHLYRFDLATGELRNQVTRGEWVVRDVERVDVENRQIWFRAGGNRAGQDPYQVHFGRVNFDGTGLTWLTEGDGTHQVQWSPDRRFFVDTWSRVDLPPVHELRRGTDGTLVLRLETADAGEYLASGRRFPTRFVAPGRDGQTLIHGIIHWPREFEPGRKYPVVENIYAGPHAAHVPKAFNPYWGNQDLTERGMIVVQIDGMGTSQRSKAFHDVCWRNLADAGFPDRIAWLKEAAVTFPEIDLTRMGIYGGSAGGQNALGALLWHGDFYHVAVADCGCHDNRVDKVWWNEQWMGYPLGPHYGEQSNVTQAHRLTGKLLLVVGELDRNVDPASTLQVVDALVKADRDFDLLLIPGAGHGAAESNYGRRRRAEFFVRHLRAGGG